MLLAHIVFTRRAGALLAICLIATIAASPVRGQTVEGDEAASRRRGGVLGPRRRPVVPPAEPEPVEAEPVAPADVTGGIAIDDGAAQFGVAAGAGMLTGRPTVRPPAVDEPPNIDGRLDDEAWIAAVHITEFVQLSPLDGAPGSEATDVYMAYDSANIYLGFHAHYTTRA